MRKIKNIFFENYSIYGSRKICKVLKKGGLCIGRRRVARLMAEAGLVPITRKKVVNTTDSKHHLEIFPNLLMQDFSAAKPNSVWVSDFTYISTAEGWLYVCSVIDLYSRRVVGWATSSKIDRNLAIKALETAIEARKPKEGFIFHTDRGSQYASEDFRNAVAAAKGIQSMSRSGNPYDNACAESFFKTLKVESIDRGHFSTRKRAEEAVARYMLYYNHKRIHASLGYASPAEYERMMIIAA